MPNTENFVTYLKQNKKSSENTVSSYVRDLNKFFSYIESLNISPLSVNKQTVISYINLMQENGQATSSVLRSVASLRAFYKYLVFSGKSEVNPVEGITTPKPDERNISVLTSRETDLLLNQPVAVGFKGCRDKAMLELLYATGIKVSELMDLKISDINLAEAFISCGKGAKARIVPLGNMALKALKDYMNTVRENNSLIADDNDYLFVNVSGGKMSRQGFWKIIKFYKDKAKIKKEITPNTLRHSFAVHLIESGADTGAVQEMLGHTTELSTKIYSDMVNKRLDNAYKKACRKTKS